MHLVHNTRTFRIKVWSGKLSESGLALRHAIAEQHVTGDIASPLTHCSVMMVSQLQTISEHALYMFSGGLAVLWA